MRLRDVAVALALVTASLAGVHAETYPSRPLTMIVPSAAGGPTDTLTCILTERMRVFLGQPFIIENNGEDEPIDDGENWEILTAPSAYEGMVEALKKAGIEPASASVSMIPDTFIKLEGQQASTMIRLMEALEDHDDVQNVHSNFDIDEKLLEEVAG